MFQRLYFYNLQHQQKKETVNQNNCCMFLSVILLELADTMLVSIHFEQKWNWDYEFPLAPEYYRKKDYN